VHCQLKPLGTLISLTLVIVGVLFVEDDFLQPGSIAAPKEGINNNSVKLKILLFFVFRSWNCGMLHMFEYKCAMYGVISN
jgi:hypothetical protein